MSEAPKRLSEPKFPFHAVNSHGYPLGVRLWDGGRRMEGLQK